MSKIQKEDGKQEKLKVIDQSIHKIRRGEWRFRGKFRWIMFSLGILFFILASLRGVASDAITAFILGLFLGFVIDYFGTLFNLWTYARGSFKKREYFVIVIPIWGIFSMILNMLWEMPILWNWLLYLISEWYLIAMVKVVIITLILFCLHELSNLKTRSWSYGEGISNWIITIGWFPLILGFRYIYVVLSYLHIF